MLLNINRGDAMKTRVPFVAPTRGCAGENSANFRVDGHAQVPAPLAGGMGHRTWSQPIT